MTISRKFGSVRIIRNSNQFFDLILVEDIAAVELKYYSQQAIAGIDEAGKRVVVNRHDIALWHQQDMPVVVEREGNIAHLRNGEPAGYGGPDIV